jgi:hypothetical protein
MRAFPRISFAIFLIVLFITSLAFAWTEPVKIVDYSNTLSGLKVVTVGETLYVAFCCGPYQVCYIYSRDNGLTWSRRFILNDTLAHNPVESPEIRSSNGKLHLVWSELTYYPQIWHIKSINGGRSWSQPSKVFNNSTSRLAFFPSLATNGDSLFLTCVTYDTSGIYGQFIFLRSLNAGRSWQDSSAIEQGHLGILQPPYLSYSHEMLHFVHPMIVQTDSFSYEIYYKRSSDAGLTWSNRIILSPAELYPNDIASQTSSAYADSQGHVLVAWMDYANGSMCGISGDIFYRLSLDNGETWRPYGSITNTQSGWYSSSLILADKFYVAWSDFWELGCGFPKEAFSTTSDSGHSWEPTEFISGPAIGDESVPNLVYTISQADTILHCLFIRTSNDSANRGIYYIRNRDFVGIDENNSAPTISDFSLIAYPNAFNGSTMITLNNPRVGEVELEIYNILGQRVWHKSMDGKEGTIIWDAKDMDGNGISSGTYFVRATSGENSQTIKLIYLK